MEHLGEQGGQGTDKCRIGQKLQECTEECDQAHLFLSLLFVDNRTEF